MRRRAILSWKDIFFLLGTVLFFFGCIASSHRCGRTLQPGQVSYSGSYLQANDRDNPDSEPIRLLAADLRVGLARGIDMGLAHTWDVSEGNEGMYSAFWGDLMVQVNNRDNAVGLPIFSTGLMKGYIYDECCQYHVTTFPLIVSVPVNENVTPYLIYRHEFIDSDFLSFDRDPRMTAILGADFSLRKPVPGQWTPRLGLSVGTFNSPAGWEGDGGFTLNIGLGIDSPKRETADSAKAQDGLH